ncbi:MAG: M20/M25/M40 family metallo-hydrolase, partial [Gemmatimonas sp.]
RRPLVDAEYVLNIDSGGGDGDGDTITAYAMQSAEKVYLDLEIVARGPGGHSSVPDGETPIDALARALGRLGRYQFPVKLNAVVRAFFEARAPATQGETGRAMAALVREPNDLAAQNVLVREKQFNALLRTTCIATMLRAGTAPNAIPQEAAATVNCRILPGESPDSVIATLERETADTSLAFRILTPALASPPSMPTGEIRTILARALSVVTPGVPIVPYMESGGTDAGYFRNLGIPAYGVSGMFVNEADVNRMHGRDERISVRAFRRMVSYSEGLLAAAGNTPLPLRDSSGGTKPR